MSFITESQLSNYRLRTETFSKDNIVNINESYITKPMIFLSHKHDESDTLQEVIAFFKNYVTFVVDITLYKIMIDTLETSERLVKKGFTDMQAKSLTRLLAEQEKRLATKKDIQELKEDNKSLRNEMRWLFGMAGVLIGLIIAVLKFI